METYTKISEFEIEITKPVEVVEVVKNTYKRDFIESQIEKITKDKEDYIAKRDAELVECNQILSEMDKLNIITKPIEIKEEIVEPLLEEISIQEDDYKI
jgi:hypothetical protein